MSEFEHKISKPDAKASSSSTNRENDTEKKVDSKTGQSNTEKNEDKMETDSKIEEFKG